MATLPHLYVVLVCLLFIDLDKGNAQTTNASTKIISVTTGGPGEDEMQLTSNEGNTTKSPLTDSTTISADVCLHREVTECFVGLLDIPFRVALDKSVCSFDEMMQKCQEKLWYCRMDYGQEMVSAITPFFSTIAAVIKTLCEAEQTTIVIDETYPECRMDKARECFGQFAMLLSSGSLVGTCKQTVESIQCIEEATETCPEFYRDLMIMGTSLMKTTRHSLCMAYSCSVDLAERAVTEAYLAISYPMSMDGGTKLACWWTETALVTAANYLVECSSEMGWGKDDMGGTNSTNGSSSYVGDDLWMEEDEQWLEKSGEQSLGNGTSSRERNSSIELSQPDKIKIDDLKAKFLSMYMIKKETCPLLTTSDNTNGDYGTGFESLFVLVEIIQNPYSPKHRICELIDEATSQFLRVAPAEGISESHVEEYRKSLDFIRNVLAKQCNASGKMEESNRTEEGTPCMSTLNTEETMCNLNEATNCVDFARLGEVTFEGLMETAYEPCRVFNETLNCVHNVTTGCKMENLDRVKTLIGKVISFLPSKWNCDLALEKELPICKEKPVCRPDLAVADCLSKEAFIGGDKDGICHQANSTLVVCLKQRIGACSLAYELGATQFSLDRFLKMNECETGINILPKDYTYKSTQCFVQFSHSMVMGLKNSSQFEMTLCSSLNALYACMETADLTPVMRYFEEKDGAAYRTFWAEQCTRKIEQETDIGTSQGHETCSVASVEKAATCVVSWLFKLQSEDGCGPHVESMFQSCIEAAVVNCTETRKLVFKSAVTFGQYVHIAKCSMQIPENKTCAPELVEYCLEEFGYYMGGSSIYNIDVCRKLERTIGCVQMFSDGCDNNTMTKIRMGLDAVYSMVGNIKCEHLNRTCIVNNTADHNTNTTITMDGTTNEKDPEIVQGKEDMFCRPNSTCSVTWNSCLRSSVNETCKNYLEVRNCIEEKIQGCSPFHILVLTYGMKGYVESYINITKYPDCHIYPKALNVSGDIDVPALGKCRHDYNESNGVKGFCASINSFTECVLNSKDLKSDAVTTPVKAMIRRSTQLVAKSMTTMAAMCNYNEEMDSDMPTKDNNTESLELCSGVSVAYFCLTQLHSIIKWSSVAPQSDRMHICEELDMAKLCVVKSLGYCMNRNANQTRKAYDVISAVVDGVGICTPNIMNRECEPDTAMECVSNLGKSVMENNKMYSKHSICSKVLTTDLCVSMKTSGCNSAIRMSVEATYAEIKSFVQHICSPPESTNSSMKCVMPQEKGMCDVSGAASCALSLHIELLKRQPDWNHICLSVSSVRICMQRFLSECNDCEISSIHEAAKRLFDKIGKRCPQVTCDLCGAYQCIDKLDMAMREGSDVCLIHQKIRNCVSEKTYTCDLEMKQTVRMKLNILSKAAEAHCIYKIHSDVEELKTTAQRVWQYDIPMQDPSKSTNTSMVEKEETGNQEKDIPNCYEYTDDPWWINETVDNVTDNNNVSRENASNKVCNYNMPIPIELREMCMKAYGAWESFNRNMFFLNEEIRETVMSTLEGILQVVKLKCRGRPRQQCHRCHKAGSDAQCDIQPLETCSHNMQMCQTIRTEKYISKKCINPSACKQGCNGNGKSCKSCCVGYLCNMGVSLKKPDIQESESCEIQTSMWCAFNLVSNLMKNSFYDCSLVKTSLSCMLDHSINCTSQEYSAFTLHISKMQMSKFQMWCERRELDNSCGLHGVMSLASLIRSPYIQAEPVCRYANEVQMNLKNFQSSNKCTKEDFLPVREGIGLVYSIAGSECASKELTGTTVTPTAVCPVIDEAVNCTSVKANCTLDSDCNPELKCCFDGCVKKCVKISLMTLTVPFSTTAKPKENSVLACPDLGSGDSCKSIARFCGTDMDCKEGQFCCQVGCIYECVEAVPIKNMTKKGFCPSANGRVGACVNQCNGDMECEGNQKCCFNGCGHTCQEPLEEEPYMPDFCSMPPETGPCKGLLPYWFYNSTRDACEQFKYGGCEGNRNRFASDKQCLKVCDYGSLAKQCTLPLNTGSCNATSPAWYYDMENNKCKEFMYGGCDGNDNRFDDEMSCMQICNVEGNGTTCTVDNIVTCIKDGTAFLATARFMSEEYRCSYIRSIMDCLHERLGKCPMLSVDQMASIRIKTETFIGQFAECNLTWTSDSKDLGDEKIEEVMPCSVSQALACFAVVQTEKDICKGLKGLINCTSSFLPGCNTAQLIPVSFGLKSYAKMLKDPLTCNVSIPEKDDLFRPLTGCLMALAEDSARGMDLEYLPRGKPNILCETFSKFETCIYKLNLPPIAKVFAGGIKDMVANFEKQLCINYKNETTEKPLQCHSCHNANSNEECNTGKPEVCKLKESCQTIVEIIHGNKTLRVTKGCKNTVACMKQIGCSLKDKRCNYCCDHGLCNSPIDGVIKVAVGEMPTNNTSGNGSIQVLDSEGCQYMMASTHITLHVVRFLTSPFLQLNERKPFCTSLVENVIPQVGTLMRNCSNETLDRLLNLAEYFTQLNTFFCPVAGQENEVNVDANKSCAWNFMSCLHQAYPYIFSYHNRSFGEMCPILTDSLRCVIDGLLSCDKAEREIINIGLGMMRQILNDHCENATILFCNAMQPTCDLDEASACFTHFVDNFKKNDTMNNLIEFCSQKQTVVQCIQHYTPKCNETEKQLIENKFAVDLRSLAVLGSQECGNKSVGTFKSCKPLGTCSFISSLQLVITFIYKAEKINATGQTKTICQEVLAVQTKIETLVQECSAFQIDIVGNAIMGAAGLYDCEVSFTFDYKENNFSKCVWSLSEKLMTIFSNASLHGLCNAMQSFLTCTEFLDDIVVTQTLRTFGMEQLKTFVNITCPKEWENIIPPKAPATCQPSLAAACLVSTGLPILFGELLNIDDKSFVCDAGYATHLKNCSVFIADCPKSTDAKIPDQIRAVYSSLDTLFQSVLERSPMCTFMEPGPISTPEPGTLPKKKCNAVFALDCIANLSMSLTESISSKNHQKTVCRSFEYVDECVLQNIKDCDELKKASILMTWKQVHNMAMFVCDPSYNDTVFPAEPPVPECISLEEEIINGSCEPALALQYVAALDGDVFNPLSTRGSTCWKMRQSIFHFRRNMVGCAQEVFAPVQTIMYKLLNKVENRCNNIWCMEEKEDEANMCKLMEAEKCLTSLIVTIMMDNRDAICMSIGQTRKCIEDYTMLCQGIEKLPILQAFESIEKQFMSLCEIKGLDPADCLDNFLMKVHQLFKFSNTVQNASSEQGSQDSFNGSKSSTGNDTKDNIGTNIDVAGEMNVTNDCDIKYGLEQMCSEVYQAWKCVETSLEDLPERLRLMATMPIEGVLKVVQEKCRPMMCYSCAKLGENNLCNAQPFEICSAQGQSCMAMMDGGYYKKGCQNPKTCQEMCTGKEHCYCCTGDKCNHPGFPHDAGVCDVETAVSCAFNITRLFKSAEIYDAQIIKMYAVCLVEKAAGCLSEITLHLHYIGLEILHLLEIGQCVAAYGDPMCGTSAVVSLGHVMKSSFFTQMSLCGQYHASVNGAVSVKHMGFCSGQGVSNLEESFTLANIQVDGICSVEYITAETEVQKICNITGAVDQCINKLDDGSQTDPCSMDSLNGVIRCINSHVQGCLSVHQLDVGFTMYHYLSMLSDHCERDYNVSLILSQILVTDTYFVLSDYILRFGINLYEAMLYSVDFTTDFCKLMSDVEHDVNNLKLPALAKLYTADIISRLAIKQKELCYDGPTNKSQNTVLECEEAKVDLVIILDASSSVTQNNFNKMKVFAEQIANYSNISSGAVRIGVLTYSTNVKDIFYLKTYSNKGDVIQAIQNIEYTKGNTNTAGAIQRATDTFFMKGNGDRDDVRNVLVILTDGKSNINEENTIKEANNARASGIHIFAVGIKDADEQELNGIADKPAIQNRFFVDEFDKLAEILDKLFIRICREVIPSKCDFSLLAYNLSMSVVKTMMNRFSPLRESPYFCRVLSELTTIIVSATVNCSAFQGRLLTQVHMWIVTETKDTCLGTQLIEDSSNKSCSLVKAQDCLADFAPYLACHAGENLLCPKLSRTLACMKQTLMNCKDITIIKNELVYIKTLIRDRCPDLTEEIMCFNVNSTKDEQNKTVEKEPEQNCNDTVITVVKECTVKELPMKNIMDLLSICTTVNLHSLGKCVSDGLSTCADTKILDKALELLQEPLELLRATCENDSLHINLTLPQKPVEPINECLQVPVCAFHTAQECMNNIEVKPGTPACGLYTQTAECVYKAISGCNDIERAAVTYLLREFGLSRKEFEICVKSATNWTIDANISNFTACAEQIPRDVAKAMTEGGIGFNRVCSAFQNFAKCAMTSLENKNIPVLVSKLYKRQLSTSVLYLNTFCTNLEANINVTEDDCDSSEVLSCLKMYTVPAVLGAGFSKDSQKELCSMFGKNLQCMVNMTKTCSKSRNELLRLVKHLADMAVYSAELCTDEPLICSPYDAVYCISELGQMVASFDTIGGDSEEICRAINYTQMCVEYTTNACSRDKQLAIRTTYEKVECLALDICPSADKKTEDPPVRGPVDCIDPAIVSKDAGCRPMQALYCIEEMKMKLYNPFRRDDKIVCLNYEETIRCVHDNLYNCGVVDSGLIPAIFENLKAQIPELLPNCSISIKSPCKEQDSCQLSLAESCFTSLKAGAQSTPEFCLSLELLADCVEKSVANCSDRVKLMINKRKDKLVSNLNLTCGDTFLTCEHKLWIYTIKIFELYKNRLISTHESDKVDNKSSNINNSYEIDLGQMCEAFSESFTCVTKKISFVPSDFITLMEFVYKKLYGFTHEICMGPRPGECPVIDMKVAENCDQDTDLEMTCQIDADCPSPAKCCNNGCLNKCTFPGNGENITCHVGVIQYISAVYQSVTYLFMEKGNYSYFCSSYSILKESVTLATRSCSLWRQTMIISLIMQIDVTYDLLCTFTPPNPDACHVDLMMECVTNFEILVKTVNRSEICSAYNAARACIITASQNCNESVISGKLVQLKTLFSQSAVVCQDIPSFKFTNVSDVIRVVEGQISDGPSIIVQIEEPPSAKCFGQACNIQMRILLDEDNSSLPSCGNREKIRQLLIKDSCSLFFTDTNWNQTRTIRPIARLDNRVEKSPQKVTLKIVVELYINGASKPALSREIQKFKVVVVDADKDNECSSINDPHIKTFDGLKYDNHMQGEFILYQHKTLPYAVHTFYQTCGQSGDRQPACNCAVFIKSGDDVFVIDRCKRKDQPDSKAMEALLYKNGQITPGTTIKMSGDGKRYYVVLPTGTVVTVLAGKKLLNVYITPSTLDWKNTKGLCGNYDGDSENDLWASDGTIYKVVKVSTRLRPDNFSESWRVHNSIRLGVVASSIELSSTYCLCSIDGIRPPQCSSSLLSETCDLVEGEDVTSTLSNAFTEASRRRRAIIDPTGTIDYNPSYTAADSSWPTASGITEEQATKMCMDALSNTSYVKEYNCTIPQQTLSGCIEDIKLTGSDEFIPTAIQDLQKVCYTTAIRQASDPLTVANLISMNCLNSCSGHGQCLNGTCLCDTGYMASDCSLGINASPTITRLLTQQCTSTTAGLCDTTVVFGDQFVNTRLLTCHEEELEISATGIKRSGRITKSNATFETFNIVTCPVKGTLPLYAALISVSNNGINSGNPQLYIISNPLCYTCDVTNATFGTCMRKTTSCVVSGVCYGAGESNPSNKCYICDPFTNDWSYKISNGCPQITTTTMTTTVASDVVAKPRQIGEYNDKTVVGISAGIAAFAFVVVIAVIIIFIVKKKSLSAKKKKKTRFDLSSEQPSSSSGRSIEVNQAYYPTFENLAYTPTYYPEPEEYFSQSAIHAKHSSKRHQDAMRP